MRNFIEHLKDDRGGADTWITMAVIIVMVMLIAIAVVPGLRDAIINQLSNVTKGINSMDQGNDMTQW